MKIWSMRLYILPSQIVCYRCTKALRECWWLLKGTPWVRTGFNHQVRLLLTCCLPRCTPLAPRFKAIRTPVLHLLSSTCSKVIQQRTCSWWTAWATNHPLLACDLELNCDPVLNLFTLDKISISISFTMLTNWTGIIARLLLHPCFSSLLTVLPRLWRT
jgi:hypothetical protein